jgi:CubicO group peptidase (beta-lactamase class C family)
MRPQSMRAALTVDRVRGARGAGCFRVRSATTTVAATGPYFWIDPQEKLVAVMMLQQPDIQRRTRYRPLLRNLVYQALQ